ETDTMAEQKQQRQGSAGVAQWQSRSFPSLRRGFDSLHPLHSANRSAMEGTGDRLPQLLDIARLIAREPDAARLVERILATAKQARGADGGSIYLVEDDRCTLSFALVLNDTLGLHLGGASRLPVAMQAPALADRDGAPNHGSVVTHCALARESVKLDAAYAAIGFDSASAHAFD